LSRSFVYICLFIFAVAIAFTFSRSTWAMLAISLAIIGFRHKKLLILAILAGFLAYFAVPRIQTRISGITDPADSAHFRLISWKDTFEIARRNLWFGVGFNSFRYAQKEYGAFAPGSLGDHSGSGSDSSFLLVLATTGIFGFILFCISYLHCASLSQATPLMLGLFIHSQFVNSLFFPQIMFLWLVAISAASYSSSRT